MSKHIKTAILLTLVLTCSWAKGQTDAASIGGSPPATVDWFARVTSTLAIVVAVAGFLWARLDKHHERKAAREAKEPAVDFDVTRGSRKGNYDYELKVTNRGDVSVQILNLACGAGATLQPDDDGELKNGKRLVDYNGLRVEPGRQETLFGEIDTTKPGAVKFTVTLRINEKTQRTTQVQIVRSLTAD